MVESNQVAKIGKQAPQFTAKAWFNKRICDVSLSDFKGKYVVLFFWPLDFTFVCPTEICAFNDAAKEFEAIGCQLIGCSIDSQFTHMEYTKKDRKKGGLGPMQIPMVADVNKTIANAYGCLVEDGENAGVTYRATYIIDDKGVLRQFSINDLPVGRNPEEVLRLVKAFKYVDEHGEVCPANWQPGKATMNDNWESKKTEEYFANQ